MFHRARKPRKINDFGLYCLLSVWSVKAYGEAEYEEYANNYDLILLGPQIRHLKPEIESKVSIPVDYIAPQHYGIMNGEAVFQDIKKILNIKEEE